MYLCVYFGDETQKEKFRENLKKARKIFREVWKVLGNGFDKNGNIKGLKEYYSNCGWDSDAENLSKEKGKLTILRLSIPKKDEHLSFNFHHYGADTKLDNKTDLRDIYLIFAEILSACFGYVTRVSDEYDDERYSVFFDENGKKYILCEDRADYIRAFKNLIETKEHLSILRKNKKRLHEVIEKKLKELNLHKES